MSRERITVILVFVVALAVGLMLAGQDVEIKDPAQNMVFAADDLAHESRQFWPLVRKEGTALEKLAYRIADHPGCSLLYDEKKTRGQMLIDLVRKTKAAGVVVSMMKFCNPEEFDYPIFKKELEAANIPILFLEIEQRMDSAEQIRTRIQSFAEMMQ